MQNRPKISPSKSSAVNSPVISPSASCARRSSSAKNSQRASSRRAASTWRQARSRARRCRSRARNTDSPVADQPAAARIAERSASSPSPVLAETAIAPGGRLELRREVDLVVDERCAAPPRPSAGACAACRAPRPRAATRSACASSRCGALDAEPLHLVGRIAQAGGVDQRERHAFDLDRFAQRVARRAGDRRDDRALFAGEPVEQARLPDVRPAREHDVDAASQQASLPAPPENVLQRRADRMQPRVRVGAVHFVDLLLGKIEHRLGQRSAARPVASQSRTRQPRTRPRASAARRARPRGSRHR